MAYQRRMPPTDPAKVPEYLRQELERLQFELNNAQEALRVVQANVSPDKPRNGEIRWADGTNWNPGLGEGLYWRADENWVRVAPPGVEWVDIDFPIIVRTVAAGLPALTTVQDNLTMPQWEVNDFNMCESQELVHGWVEGSEVYWHLHLVTSGTDGTDRYVKFEVQYAWANIGSALSSTTTLTTADLLIPANTPDKTMLIMSLGSFVPTNGRIGGHVLARLKRVAASGTAPSNDPWIPMLQLHIQVNTMGSAGIGTKVIANDVVVPGVARLSLTGHAPNVTKT